MTKIVKSFTESEICEYIKAIEFLHFKGLNFYSEFGWGNVIEIAQRHGFKPSYLTPEKTWRPWKPTEVPVGAIVRYKYGNKWPSLITQVEGIGCYIGVSKIGNLTNYRVLFEDYEYSSDNKTWQKCGVLE